MIENFSIGNGEEYIIEKEFGSHSLVITPEYAKMTFEIDSSDFVEINTPCFVVIVYDEISDEVADITCFPKSNGYTIKHIYPNATN